MFLLLFVITKVCAPRCVFVVLIAVVTPAARPVMTLRPALFSRLQSPHPLPSCFRPLKKMSPGKVLGSKFRIFQYAPQVKFYTSAVSSQLWEMAVLEWAGQFKSCFCGSLAFDAMNKKQV